ncbi:hypothetical protein EAI_04826 [Harpegnathos saltator]|uniref:Uncharacterized protein n=1 Tax=Harpegnathos saltator TaxID=610380 RepID=E2C8R7_HARSA|nr:hypothetical protein EAI_04826 [Harpegnathos saltator]
MDRWLFAPELVEKIRKENRHMIRTRNSLLTYWLDWVEERADYYNITPLQLINAVGDYTDSEKECSGARADHSDYESRGIPYFSSDMNDEMFARVKRNRKRRKSRLEKESLNKKGKESSIKTELRRRSG